MTDEYLEYIKEKRPYTYAYAKKYGEENMSQMDYWYKPPMFKTMEDFFKYCVENNVKWDDIITPPPKGCLL